jgi:predicted N-acetyltransferase YhbS
LNIRNSTQADRIEIEKIHTRAFGEKKGPEIAELVNGLFDDPSAMPIMSLVAVDEGRMIGHILFTRAVLTGTGPSASIRLLAPLAVLPDAQARGGGEQTDRGRPASIESSRGRPGLCAGASGLLSPLRVFAGRRAGIRRTLPHS